MVTDGTMSALASRPFVEQHALNRQVWERLVNDPALAETIEKVETDRDGNLIMSAPPGIPHRAFGRTISISY